MNINFSRKKIRSCSSDTTHPQFYKNELTSNYFLCVQYLVFLVIFYLLKKNVHSPISCYCYFGLEAPGNWQHCLFITSACRAWSGEVALAPPLRHRNLFEFLASIFLWNCELLFDLVSKPINSLPIYLFGVLWTGVLCKRMKTYQLAREKNGVAYHETFVYLRVSIHNQSICV